MHFDGVQTAVRLRHRRYADERALLDVGKRSLGHPRDLRVVGESQFRLGAVARFDDIDRAIDPFDGAAHPNWRRILRESERRSAVLM